MKLHSTNRMYSTLGERAISISLPTGGCIVLLEKRACLIEFGGVVSLIVDDSITYRCCLKIAFSHSMLSSFELLIVRSPWKVV